MAYASQSNVTLPLDLTAHGMSTSTFGTVLAVNGVLVVLLQPFAGRMMGRMRRASALAWASALTGLGFGLHTLGANPALATLGVVVWTLGEIAQAPVGSAVVADLAPPDQRGTYQGAYYMMWALSSCLAPTIGSWVLGRHGGSVLWGSRLSMGLFAAAWHMAVADARRRLDTLRLIRPEVSAALD